MSNFTEMDCYLMGQATHYDIYRKMGAHHMTMDGKGLDAHDIGHPGLNQLNHFALSARSWPSPMTREVKFSFHQPKVETMKS